MAMDLYIPENSFASQYPEWAAWHWSNYKRIRTNPARKTDGALLFVEGKVDQLTPLKDRSGFEARVTSRTATAPACG